MRTIWVFIVGIILVLLCAAVPKPVWQRGLALLTSTARMLVPDHAEEKKRAEIHMLDVISAGTSSGLEAGDALPASWMGLSNMTDMTLIAGICERYRLPPAAEIYVVLHQPVSFRDYGKTGLVFLVRTKPCRWGADSWGRWALAAGIVSQYAQGTARESNVVFRIWLSERDLPEDLHAQLTAKAGPEHGGH